MTTPEIKLCILQVKAGPSNWRTVMDFEVEDADEVMNQAHDLFMWGFTKCSKGIRLRIMKTRATTAPLMTWSENDGWEGMAGGGYERNELAITLHCSRCHCCDLPH